MLRVTLRNIVGHKVRLLLVAVAVTLGVSFVAGTYVLTDTTNKAFTNLISNADQATDVVVRAPAVLNATSLTGGRDPIPDTLVGRVRAVPGVRDAAGVVIGAAQILGKDGKVISASGGTVGMSTSPGSALSGITANSGSLPAGPDAVAIDVTTARVNNLHVGDAVRILFVGGPRAFHVSGTVQYGGSDTFANATLAAFDPQTAQQVLNRAGLVDEIRVAAVGGLTQAQLRDRIDAAIQRGYEVITGADYTASSAKSVQDGLTVITTTLLVFAVISLFVGAFIIMNTFAILLAQRRRELALLRALGATSRQVVGSVMLEAFMVGALASLAGLGLGILVALGLRGLMSSLGVALPSTTLDLEPRTIAVSLVLGIGVTLTAAVSPAVRTRRVPPVAAMNEDAIVMASHISGRRIAAGTTTTAIAVVTLVAGLSSSSESGLLLFGAGAFLTFIGVGILGPLVARPSARLIGWPMARLLGFAGRLGRQNAMRNPLRTSRTAAALMIGVGLVGFATVLGSSLKASVDDTVNNAIGADLIVNNLSSSASADGFSPDAARRISALPQVARLGEFRFGVWKDGSGATQKLQAADPATFDGIFKLTMTAGSTRDLAPNTVLLSRTMADSKGYKLGQELDMSFARTGHQGLRIVGLFDSSKNAFAGTTVISLATYEVDYTDQRDRVIGVNLRPGVSATAGRDAVIRALTDYPNLSIDDQTSLKQREGAMVDQVINIIYVLLSLAIVIAVFGIVNTLALSVFERKRELGLLRAVGMTRRQVRRMIRYEAVIVSVIGAYLGVVVGSFFGWVTVRALADQGITSFAYPIGTVLVFMALAAMAGVVAAFLPARRAANSNVLLAIAST